MFLFNKTNKAHSLIEQPILGRTLPSLLDEVCDRQLSSGDRTLNHQAFNQWQKNTWQAWSSQKMRLVAEELALGLLEKNLNPGDKIAFLMHSDLHFCLADFASLLAGLINVPLDLAETLDNIAFILHHSEAKALIVSDLDLLAQIIPYLEKAPNLQIIIVADIPDDWSEKRTQLLTCGLNECGVNQNSEAITVDHELKKSCLCIPMLLCQARQDLHCPELPQCIQLFSLDEIQASGKKLWQKELVQELKAKLAPQDLATIVYIAGETGKPKGVMLSHENITADILTTFASIPDLQPGTRETVLSFLPLNHIFARALIYGHVNYGHSIYFSNPNRAIRDFIRVKPSLVATIPRLLEKIQQKILDRGNKLTGSNKIIFNWALKLAQNYQLGKPLSLFDRLQLKLADQLVFAQWRKPFGGRLKYFISGGAGLKAEIANMLSAAGMTVLQGYGLTETSSVICCNQAQLNRAGTVGLPIPGVKIAIAADQEILVKAPYVMQGYYKNPEATQAVIDSDGWLHTGDLGEFTSEGFLTITGSKKDLFKLSTGKYVIPQPLETHLKRSPLVTQAVVVGRQKKFCGMLIFPNVYKLQEQAEILGLDLPSKDLWQQPEIFALYQDLVDEANLQLPLWSNVKHFQLIDAELSVANGLLHQDLKVNRTLVNQRFASEINALYGEETALSSEYSLREKLRYGVRSSELWKLPQLELLVKQLKLLALKVFPDYLQRHDFDLVEKIEHEHQNNKSTQPINRLHSFSFKEYLQVQALGKRLKNYLTLPSTMPWNLPEENDNAEELDSIEGRKA